MIHVQQASCGDCGFNHDPLTCYFRADRKRRLTREVIEKRTELAGLETYEAERASGRVTFKISPLGGSHIRPQEPAIRELP
jgi:hypothetical protein